MMNTDDFRSNPAGALERVALKREHLRIVLDFERVTESVAYLIPAADYDRLVARSRGMEGYESELSGGGLSGS